MSTQTLAEFFGEPIHTYTRAQALADGFQVAVPEPITHEAGIRFPVFMTRSVWDSYVAVPPTAPAGQSEQGRLWDVLFMLRFAIMRQRSCKADTVNCQLYVQNHSGKPKLVTLYATCGPVDIDNPAPAITVMLPGED